MKRAIVLLPVLFACGSTPPPPPEQPKTEETTSKPTTQGPVIEQELGSLDERAVAKKLEQLTNGPIEKCHEQGRSRLEYLTGDVKLFMRIGKDGRVKYTFLEQSTLGDRETEKCILDVLSNADWPKPVGGEGEVRNGFGWGAGNERAPTPWGPEKVLGALDDHKSVKKDVEKCKGGVKGDFIVTAYVEHDDNPEPEPPATKAPATPPKKPKGKKAGKNDAGKFRALGATPPNKDGADKVDCIIDALKPLRLPTPGSYAAKVSFPL